MAVSMRLPRLPWRILRASRALTVVPARARCSTAVSRSAITARADRYSGQQQPHGHQQQEIVLSRHRILEEVPYETHKVVGVTFEDRQPRVAKLHKGQPVVFVREPNNPFDPNAVAVQTLDGQHLGYMPRDINHRFLLDTCFGYVYSVGQTEQGLWGFQTAVQPSVAPVQVFAFPSTLVPHANLVPQLSGPAWEAMKSIILKAAGNRCKITGATGVEMHEEWVFDDGAQVLRLAGFQPISSEVHQVQHMLQLQSGSPQQQEAQRLLASLNQWRDADAHIYVQHMQQVQQQRSQQPNWKLDLGLLSSLQIQPPASIPRSLIVS